MTRQIIQGKTFDIDLSKWRTEENPVTEEEIKEFAEANPEIQNWMRRKENPAYPRHLKVYCDMVNLTPSELLDLKAQFGDTTAEELLETVQYLLNQKHGVRFKGKIFGISQVFNMTTATKSWYGYNGRTLAKGRATYYYKKVHKKIQYTKEDLIKFIDGQDIQFQTWVAFLSSFPPRIETFTLLDWSHVREVFDESIKLTHVRIEPELLKKRLMELGVEQHGFLHSWARKKLLEWRKEWEKITGKKLDLANPESLNQPLWIRTRGEPKRLTKGNIEKHFRNRSKAFGKRITPHSFRAFFKSNIRCGEDEKAVFLGQSGRHNRAYNMELIEKLREYFREATKDLNPLHTEKFVRSKKIIKERFKGRLKEEELEWLAKQMSLGLMKMEHQFEELQDQFLARFLSNVGVQLKERRVIAKKERHDTKTGEEEEFPYTKKSWKGIYREGEEEHG